MNRGDLLQNFYLLLPEGEIEYIIRKDLVTGEFIIKVVEK